MESNRLKLKEDASGTHRSIQRTPAAPIQRGGMCVDEPYSSLVCDTICSNSYGFLQMSDLLSLKRQIELWHSGLNEKCPPYAQAFGPLVLR